jgi:hypothetical protein
MGLPVTGARASLLVYQSSVGRSACSRRRAINATPRGIVCVPEHGGAHVECARDDFNIQATGFFSRETQRCVG